MNAQKTQLARTLMSALFCLGYTEGMQVFFDDCNRRKELQEAGFVHGCYALEGPPSRWAFGWKAPALPPTQVVKVQSDNSGDIYEVTVGGDEALSCTCKAGEHNYECKHLYRGRVKAAGSFVAAIKELIRAGAANNKHAVLEVFQERSKASSVNEAIASIIRSAFGINHPHAIPPKKKGKSAVMF